MENECPRCAFLPDHMLMKRISIVSRGNRWREMTTVFLLLLLLGGFVAYWHDMLRRRSVADHNWERQHSDVEEMKALFRERATPKS